MITGLLKFAGRWVFRGVLVLIALVVALVLLQDRIFQAWAESRLEKETGLQVDLRHAEFSLRSGRVRFEGLKIYNPAAFGGTPFIDLEEFQAEVDQEALKQRKLHFRLLCINLAELTLVQDKQGRFNYEVIKEQMEQRKHGSKGGRDKKGEVSVPLTFEGIDTLNLTLGKVRSINLNYPDKPAETDLQVHDRVMTDIRTQADFQNKVLPVLLQGGVSFFYQFWQNSEGQKPQGKGFDILSFF